MPDITGFEIDDDYMNEAALRLCALRNEDPNLEVHLGFTNKKLARVELEDFQKKLLALYGPLRNFKNN